MVDDLRPQLTSSLTVGLLQTAPRFGEIADNIAAIAAARAELDEVDLAVSPELSVTGYGFDPLHPEWLLTDSDPRLEVLPPGTGIGYAERPAPGATLPRNAYALRIAGTQVQHKLHPVSYAPWNEHLTFSAGLTLPVGTVYPVDPMDSPAIPGSMPALSGSGVRVATLICNDMWHPVMPWFAVHAGAEVILAPVASLASVGVRRTWETILEHTARLLQCYVVFVNRCGEEGGQQFWGGSRVMGPDGSTLVELGDEPASTRVTLDLAALRELRRNVPILRESRPPLVTELLSALPGLTTTP